MSSNDSTAHILQSLMVNTLIAGAKGIGAFITGSGAMLAETIHSAADCTNQVLLLLGVKRSQKPPSVHHPLGYGRDMYFWSFIVALLLFSGGGVFSIYEGIHKFYSPEPVEYVLVGIGIMLFALALEGYATFSNIKEMRRRSVGMSLFKYLRQTKDSDLVVVFGENSAATCGLLFAIVAQVMAGVTGDSRWDALGCLCIGIVLVGVAIFLSIEVKSLLIGESASGHIENTVKQIVDEHSSITDLLHLISVQQGPGQVMLLVKMGFIPTLDAGALSDVINDFEKILRERLPEVRWCFVEPDRPRLGTAA
jgi:cation diffusion facilitator family transporter